MVTSRIVLKANINGKTETADQTRKGVAANILTFKADGTVADPNDLFNIRTNTWAYSISGSELTFSKTLSGAALDKSYFTIKLNGNTMTWNMDTNQAKRSLTDSFGKNYALNADKSINDQILELGFTIEFVKK